MPRHFQNCLGISGNAGFLQMPATHTNMGAHAYVSYNPWHMRTPVFMQLNPYFYSCLNFISMVEELSQPTKNANIFGINIFDYRGCGTQGSIF